MTAKMFGVIACLVGALVAAPGPDALAGSSTAMVTARLIPGIRGEDGTRVAGLRLVLADGWKTYWRAPGDAGIPPQFDWSASRNVSEIEMLWPTPHVFESFGLSTVGYEGVVVFPVRVRVTDPDAPLVLSLAGQVGVCRQVCVLEPVQAAAIIDPDAADIGGPQVVAALGAVPQPAREAGLLSARCWYAGATADGAQVFHAELVFEALLDAADILVEPGPDAWVNERRIEQTGGVLRLTAEIGTAAPADTLSAEDIRLTIIDGLIGADLVGCAAGL